MKRYGPDSLSSWVIALACCFINMMMYGMARLSGVLFVASVPRFNVGRQKASFPYTFCDFVRNSSGPLVGYLGHKFGLRFITAIGAVVGALGAGLCYFAESIGMVTFFWGVIFGFGFGLGSVLLPVSVNQYFDKNRAIASGIALSGGCLGSFALPPIVELLINNYGLSQTFLFLSGFILNCLPAALLLRKPDFEIQKPNLSDSNESETQSIISGKTDKLYTVEKDSQKTNILIKPASVLSATSSTDGNMYKNYKSLRYDEGVKRLSTQSLLSNSSIDMSSSEPIDGNKTIETSRGRRQLDSTRLKGKAQNLSSFITDPDSASEKHEALKKTDNSSIVQQDKSLFPNMLPRSLSAGHIFRLKNTDFSEKTIDQTYQSYACKTTQAEHLVKDRPDMNYKIITSKNTASKHLVNKELSFSRSYPDYSDDQHNPGLFKKFHNLAKYEQNVEWLDKNSAVGKKDVFYKKESIVINNTSSLGPFSIIFDPMFLLIAITNALYCFTFVCMVTIIVDYAKDLKVGESNEKYVLMLMSVGDLVGRLTLGFVTDRGFMSTAAFSALCFACQGLFIAATAWSNGFVTLLIFVTLYGLSESGIIVIFPVIISQYIEPDKQTVAIPSSNFLSGPLCLAVAPLIGYFRDDVGSYDWIFYGLAILSAVCCLSWMFAPCIAKSQKRKQSNT